MWLPLLSHEWQLKILALYVIKNTNLAIKGTSLAMKDTSLAMLLSKYM